MDIVRITTGLILAGVTLCVFAFAPFTVVYSYAAVVGLLGLWEWIKLSGIQGLGYQLIATAVIAVSIYMLELLANQQAVIGLAILLSVSVFWLVAFFLVLRYPVSAKLWRHRLPLKLFAGFIVFAGLWFGTLYLLAQPLDRYLILVVVSLVAFADTGAYFAGRRFGKRKLSPKVSPGKSWEGLVGGIILSTLIGVLLAAFVLNAQSPIWLGLLLSVPVALVSVVGDLTESMLKREAGCKDSSRLIPGHGGVLDRIDALVAGVPVFACVHFLATSLAVS